MQVVEATRLVGGNQNSPWLALVFCVSCILGLMDALGSSRGATHVSSFGSCTSIAFAQLGIRPMRFPCMQKGYRFPLLTLCTPTSAPVSQSHCATMSLNQPHHVSTVPCQCQGWRTDTCLHFFQDACNEVVM
jgi:hypothetical protein